MKKNGFLTFCCACVPGVGQMYYGYMKRGVSLLGAFCLVAGATSLLGALSVLMPVIWVYSFFDTYDLIRHMVDGNPRPDAFLVGEEDFKAGRVPSYSKMLGWGAILLGVWMLYENVLCRLIMRAIDGLFSDKIYYFINSVLYNTIPAIVVACLLVWLGIRLLGGKKNAATVTVGEDAIDVAAAAELPIPGQPATADAENKSDDAPVYGDASQAE